MKKVNKYYKLNIGVKNIQFKVHIIVINTSKQIKVGCLQQDIYKLKLVPTAELNNMD